MSDGALLRVSIEDGARAVLGRLLALGADLFPVMDEIGASLETSTRMRFETSIGPSGQPWKPSRRAGKTLVDTGRLLASITHRADRTSVEVGSNVIYAAIHQFGGAAGRGHKTHIDPRPYLGLDPHDAREIEDIASDHLRRAVS